MSSATFNSDGSERCETTISSVIEKCLHQCGGLGRFQRRFCAIFVLAASFILSQCNGNIYMALATPEHWCFVPGAEAGNWTAEQWRELTIPKQLDTRGDVRYSNCLMYNLTGLTIAGDGQLGNYEDGPSGDRNVIGCQHGWVYDKQWYEQTAVSQEDWVCEKDLYQTNTFAFGRLGEVIGSLVFGQMGDRLGRRLTFYISILVLLAGKIWMVFAVTNYTWLVIAAVIGSLTVNSAFQAPLIIAMETAPAENRAFVALLQNFSWTVAMCVMPLLFWYLREWTMFFWITTLPLLVFLCFPSYMIESPRWLATSGRLAECAKYLTAIARINGRADIEITETYLKKMLPASDSGGTEQVYGMLSFFTGWRIARNTLLLVFCWIVCALAYFTLLLSVADLPGNPFLNFLIQSLVEFPAYIVGQRLCNTIGRRLTNSLTFAVAAVLSLVLVYAVNYIPEASVFTIVVTFAIKFCTSVTFYAVNLQSIETYPTCLRQTGISMGIVGANAFGMLGPYIVYLGKNVNSSFPSWILFGLFVFGTLCGLFTPETFNAKLPDSLSDAQRFGADQKFWSLPKRTKKEATAERDAVELQDVGAAAEAEELNQVKYAP